MISDDGMAALCAGTALVTALPNARLRIRGAERVIAEVSRPPFPDGDGTPQLPLCVFRSAITEARRRRAAGEALRFRSLPDGVDPAVDIGVPAGDRALPGGTVRTTMRGAWVQLAAVAQPAALVQTAIGSTAVGQLDDPELEASVLYASSPIGDDAAAGVALDQLAGVLGRCAVTHLEDLLRAVADAPDRH